MCLKNLKNAEFCVEFKKNIGGHSNILIIAQLAKNWSFYVL